MMMLNLTFGSGDLGGVEFEAMKSFIQDAEAGRPVEMKLLIRK